eukprot:3490948-Prorocentrum_lima.AAC.1
MSLAQERQALSTSVPSSMNGLAHWLDDYATKLALGMSMHCLIEPKTILIMVNDTIEKVVTSNSILKQVQ